MLRGSESSWRERSIGTPDDPMGSNMSTGSHTIMYMIYGDHDYPVLDWRPEQIAEVKNSPTAKVYEATSRDASAFLKKGGKWLIWHGFNDPGPAPLVTATYYEEMLRTSAPKLGRTPAQLRDRARLFLAPGVYHCGNGPGPDRFDLLGALDQWVETGKAPERIVATNRSGTLSRPLCPFPALGRYRGEGDVNDEKNFVCR
jgi:feruloyl esterase